jgi:glycosyltransferase involved in cell wall biosynthesis
VYLKWVLEKSSENTIKWFVEEFIDQEVGLILKSNLRSNSRIDKEHIEASLESILSSYPDRKCSVSLLHGDLSEGQMRALYEHDKVKAMVNISHGEGFGLPMFEAARCALPIISVGWSGQVDFLNHNDRDYFLKVSYKMALRMMYKNYDELKTQATDLQEIVDAKFCDEVLFEGFCSHFYSQEEFELAGEIEKLFSELSD